MNIQFQEPVSRGRVFFGIALWLLPPAAIAGATYYLQGEKAAEKVLTTMTMPGCFIWLLLFGVTISVWVVRQRIALFLSLQALLLYTAASSPVLTGFLVDKLQSTVKPWDYKNEEPLDAIVVLGGGVTYNQFERPQLGQAGDRVILPVVMFKSGAVKKLITTGENIAELTEPGKGHGADATAELWESLGVPASAIVKVGGRNTAEEMEELKKVLPKMKLRNVGLVTSAWHMPRAFKLAEKAELKFIPVPTDFSEYKAPTSALDILPNAGSLKTFQTVLHECLGMALGR